MSYLKILIILTAVNLTTTRSFSQNADKKPNIILIMADDLGWKDTGFMGSKFYETPNLDALARQGILFTNAYAAAANCAPSRACMMSGQNTPRHGIYTVGNSERGEKATRKLIPTVNREILPDSIFTLSEVLKNAGYYTGIIGKWHLGDDPRTQGFDFNIGGNMKGSNNYFSPYHNSAIQDGAEGEYLTDRLTTEALAFLESKSSKPFFLYLPYYAVHTPLQAPVSLKEKYDGKPKTTEQTNAVYAAMIESLDNNIGRILHKLEELHISKNTLLIFTSDNGGIRSISRQDPLRAGKGSYYEGGIRVPLLIRWPNKIAANIKTDVPVTNMDFYPTILDILSIPRKHTVLDGVTILPVLKGEKLPERPLYWHFPIYLDAYDPNTDDGRDPVFRTRPGTAIRMGNWKLHEYYEDGVKELYNLQNDVGERHNLALQNPDIVKKLHNQLVNWQKQLKAPIPVKLNPDFNPDLQFSSKKAKKQ